MGNPEKIFNYLSGDVIKAMRQSIEEALDNEVFFIGYTDDNLIVNRVEVIARGHKTAVPAVTEMAQDGDVVIHNHPSGKMAPSEADLSIAGYLDGFQVAFYIVNNPVDDIYAVIEPFSKKETKHIDTEKIKAYLLEGGSVRKKLAGFENRREQRLMIDYVCTAFNEDKIAVIEAGTGTGKTLAYLLPAIHWALENKERIVVSTNTINLQEQLIKKDLPFLKNVIKEEFQAVLVKGRRNYVCLRKIDDIENDFFQFDESEKEELKSLIKWAKNSSDGSKSDLSFIPDEDLWEKIASESDTCSRAKCPHFRECFVNKARRRASQAQILVVNHHLLFADLALRYHIGTVSDVAVLPPYQRIIFDEAHHLEDVASHYFGGRITRAGILRILSRLQRQKKNRILGLLPSLKRRVDKESHNLTPDLVNKIQNHLSHHLVKELLHLNQRTDQVMEIVYETMKTLSTGHNQYELKTRLSPEISQKLFHQSPLGDDMRDYLQSLKSFASKIHELIDWIKDCRRQLKADWSSLMIEIEAQAERLLLAAATIEDVLFQDDDQNVRWIETRISRYGNDIVRFATSPLDISQTMAEAVYESYNSVIMTSATLAVDQEFTFLKKRVGLSLLPPDRVNSHILQSPFEFEKQVLLIIPTDLPPPNHPDFAGQLSKSMLEILATTEGKAFILFTSYGLLNKIFQQISGTLEDMGITTLKQGTMNRHDLLNRFRRDRDSVLFATDSFWEGVDVVGEALENVMITRLPFKVPNEPIIEARYEAIENTGGNAFMEYAVPIAVIKLKQGFGRLIRSRTDRGTVVIFDSRVVKKSYGRKFLRSLPLCDTAIGDQKEIVNQLKSFLNSTDDYHYAPLDD